jgi:hypothetical protein
VSASSDPNLVAYFTIGCTFPRNPTVLSSVIALVTRFLLGCANEAETTNNMNVTSTALKDDMRSPGNRRV